LRHLCADTAYPLSAGAIRIKQLDSLCRAERMPLLAITDIGDLFSDFQFATTSTAASD
jgi:DNA polymerase III subunit alpha